MADRQEIKINKELTTQDLYNLMLEYWDVQTHNGFYLQNSNIFSDEPSIFLPATKRFCVMIEPCVEGIIRKEAKVVLSVVDTPKGMEDTLRRSFPATNLFSGAIKIGRLASIKKERKKVEDGILIEYTEYLRQILEKVGLAGSGYENN